MRTCFNCLIFPFQLFYFSILGKCTMYLEDVWTNVATKLLYVSDLYQTGVDVTLRDIRLIDKNASNINYYNVEKNYGLLTFINVKNVVLYGSSKNKCQFNNLVGPVFLLQSSNLILTGEILFANVIASQWAVGAAIMLSTDSMLWFLEPLKVSFCNNSAMIGGAIGSTELVVEFCVFQYQTDRIYYDDNIDLMNITIEFSNNSAQYAGNSIYMERLYSCSINLTPHIKVSNVSMVYENTFKFTERVNNGLFDMSSTPNKACVCNGDATNTSRAALSCKEAFRKSPISIFPGQTFSVNIIVVDEIYNPVFSSVHTTLQPSFNPQSIKYLDWDLGYGEDFVYIHGNNCSRLNFTISLHSEEYVKAILAIYPSHQYNSVGLSIVLKECPLGFKLSSSGVCKCSPLLAKKKFYCSINDGTVTKKDLTSWVGLVPHPSNDSVELLAYAPHCSISYCEQRRVVYYDNFNSICRYNRSGVICGKCSNNLSTVIGHPMCLECSNLWLLTIPLYAAIGLICVVLLFLLRLTVTTGTITGVIFYANIININSHFFFGYHKNNNNWLNIFISMLNLELGFPMCFYNGMTALEAAYLSFTVPISLGIILLAIVFLSRQFQFVSNITSHSVVPVMATLIYLSFSKLLRLVVGGMLFTKLIIELDDGNMTKPRYVWYLDASVEYFSVEHLILFLLAIITLLFFLIPYTVFLSGIKIFVRYRLTNLNRFKPFVDAYCAPYKDRYRFWFGLRLCVLIIAYMGYAILSNSPCLLVLLISCLLICFTTLQAVIMPYKSMVLHYLELFFLCNCIILHAVGLYSTNTNGIQVSLDSHILVNIIMAPAFLLFLAIIIYHIYTNVVLWCVHRFYKSKKEVIHEKLEISTENNSERTYSETETPSEKSILTGNFSPTSLMTYSAVLMKPHKSNPYIPGQLREPLLEDELDNN